MLRKFALLTLAVVLGTISQAAHADSVTLTLASPNQTVSPGGGTVSFTATVKASASNGAAVFLNNDNFSVSGAASLDDSGFLFTFPFSLAPGASYTGTLFTVTTSGVGPFSGGFDLLGGGTANDGNLLSTLR